MCPDKQDVFFQTRTECLDGGQRRSQPRLACADHWPQQAVPSSGQVRRDAHGDGAACGGGAYGQRGYPALSQRLQRYCCEYDLVLELYK